MDEHQRELATNRLLEIIRGKGAATTKPPETAASAAPPKPDPSPPVPEVSPPVAASPAPPVVEAPPRAPRPVAPAPFTAAQEVPDSAAKRPGMGLLEKVLSKPTTPPPIRESAPIVIDAESSQPKPAATSETTKPKDAVEQPGEVPPETAETEVYELPEDLLPFAERLKRRLSPKSGKGSSAKVTKAAKKAKEIEPSQPNEVDEKPAKPSKPTKALKVATVFVKGKRLIGIDIGAAAIKTIELLRQGNRLTITNIQMRPIPVALRKSATGLPVLQAKLLREMLPSERVRNADIGIVISDKGAQVRKVNIQATSAKELLNAIKFQIKKDLPFPLDVCEIAYRGYDPKVIGKQDIEILAVDKRAIEAPIAVLDELDFLPSVITSAPAALRFLIDEYEGIAEGPGAVVVVDIGGSKTTITIVDSEKVVLSRTLSTGGDDFTEVLTGVTLGPNGDELTPAQAEQYKMDFGLPSEREPGAMKVAILTRPVAERISTELNRSLDFYRRERSGGEIKKIILVGGGALMKRLPEFLAENVGAEIVLGSPTARVPLAQHVNEETDQTLADFGPMFLSALAVALDDGKDFNMLPQNVKGALKLKAARGVVAPIAISVVVVLIGLYAMALSALKGGEQEFEKIKQQLKDLDMWRSKSFASEAQFVRMAGELRDRQADYDSIRIGEPEIPRYLKAISNLTPENLYLEKIETKYLSEADSSKTATTDEAADPNKMNMESVLENFSKSFGDPFAEKNAAHSQAPPVKRPIYGRVIELSGIIYPQGTLTDVQLVDFVFSLENSGHFRDVAVDSMSVEGSGKVMFRILCGL